jgi:hypothetical protein
MSRFRTVVLLAVLEFGAVSGVPMPPEKIRALMDSINKQQMAHVLPGEQDDGRLREPEALGRNPDKRID